MSDSQIIPVTKEIEWFVSEKPVPVFTNTGILQTTQKRRMVARRAVVADLLSQGLSVEAITEALEVSRPTIDRDVREIVLSLDTYAKRTIDEWISRHLLILERQISQLLAEIDDEGTPARTRNMHRQTLIKFMERQDRLLQLSHQQVDVNINQHTQIVALDVRSVLASSSAREVIEAEMVSEDAESVE